MTSTHHARDGGLLWDYPEKTPLIVGILAIAACFGIGVTAAPGGLRRRAAVRRWNFGFAFFFAAQGHRALLPIPHPSPSASAHGLGRP